nr:hypothetical protein BaRGS_023680 [Batillaria attramentaria]
MRTSTVPAKPLTLASQAVVYAFFSWTGRHQGYRNKALVIQFLSPVNASPGVNFTWTGPCAGQNQPKCTFAPKISDNGKEVACIATNLVTGEARLASVLLDLNYPPLSPPVITGVDKNAMYPGESAIMTCSVPSSIPPVESVTFACLDQDEEVEGAPEITSFTMNQTSSILTIDESPADVDDDDEVVRQDGGLMVEDMFTTLTFVAPARCDSTAHYKCLADNMLGSPRLAAESSAQDVPSLVYRGKPQNLTFHVVSVPPPDIFQFFFLGLDPHVASDHPARSGILSITCVETGKRLWRRACVISVNLAEKEDEGVYKVVVKNSRGRVAFSFNLTTSGES